MNYGTLQYCSYCVVLFCFCYCVILLSYNNSAPLINSTGISLGCAGMAILWPLVLFAPLILLFLHDY